MNALLLIGMGIFVFARAYAFGSQARSVLYYPSP
jgi:hypothetical protein